MFEIKTFIDSTGQLADGSGSEVAVLAPFRASARGPHLSIYLPPILSIVSSLSLPARPIVADSIWPSLKLREQMEIVCLGIPCSSCVGAWMGGLLVLHCTITPLEGVAYDIQR